MQKEKENQMNTNFKTGQIWTNAHRSNDGVKTTNGAAVTYQRIDDVIVAIDENKQIQGCVNVTDVNTGREYSIEIGEFLENKTLFSDVK